MEEEQQQQQQESGQDGGDDNHTHGVSSSEGQDVPTGGPNVRVGPGPLLAGVLGSSPPRVMSLSELLRLANGMSNMALAHEISLNDDFKLLEPPFPAVAAHTPGSAPGSAPGEDQLRAALGQDPPDWTVALSTLQFIRMQLISLLLPRSQRFRKTIQEELDADELRKQSDGGALDLQRCGQFVVGVMQQMCAPVRDDQLRQVKQEENLFHMYSGIIQVLALMHVDMANYAIQSARPHLSAEYERGKFTEWVSAQGGPGAALRRTRAWLNRHGRPGLSEEDVLSEAMGSLLSGELVLPEKFRLDNTERLDEHLPEMERLDERRGEDVFPETFSQDGVTFRLDERRLEDVLPETFRLDERRLRSMCLENDRLVLVGAALLVTCANLGPTFGRESKEKLREDLLVLVVSGCGVGEAVASMSEHVGHEFGEEFPSLKAQVVAVGSPEHPVRKLVGQRMSEFATRLAKASALPPAHGNMDIPFPPGLSILCTQITQLASSFLALLRHNRAVFSPFYHAILNDLLNQQPTPLSS